VDVTLVLTHRCNLNCSYCYAGEHVKKDMDPAMLNGAIDLMWSDGAEVAQLGFFGGEPFLAFDEMKCAVAAAQERANLENKRLILQCTTNGAALTNEHVAFVRETGMRVTVSIDGVKQAHDLNRPTAGGRSSFEQVLRGLDKLIVAGVEPTAMMVISPETVPYAYQSVAWLWDIGVRQVRANMRLDAPWYQQDRDELDEQLTAIAAEQLGRWTRGQFVAFEPFDVGLRTATGTQKKLSAKKRKQVVVATGGNLYPCAPMVGEDNDSGPEAALRMGHLNNGPESIINTIKSRGAGCGDGKGCACAAYLETGDRDKAGPNGMWYAKTCRRMGGAVATGYAAWRKKNEKPAASSLARRPFLVGMAAAVGSAAIAIPFAKMDSPPSEGCPLPRTPVPGGDIYENVAGGMKAPPPEEHPALPGSLAPPPEPPSEVEPMILGDMGEADMVEVDGDMAEPIMDHDDMALED
jgi:uncharacterized protein